MKMMIKILFVNRILESIAILLLTIAVPLHSFGQKENNNNQKSLTGMDFDCSEIPCVYNISGTFNGDITTLKNDDGELFSGSDFQIIVGYQPNPGNPIAYVSSQPGSPNHISVNVEFEAACESLPPMVGVRGLNTEGFDFPAVEVDVMVTQGSGSTFSYSEEATNQLPTNTVNMFDLDIIWQVNTEGPSSWGDESKWETAGMSMNRVYVTWKEPEEQGGVADPLYNPWHSNLESYFYIGCSSALGSTGGNSQLIAEIWETFNGQNVINKDGNSLKYYNPWGQAEINTDPNLLIRDQNGQCTAWSKAFLSVIKAVGVEDVIGHTLFLQCSQYVPNIQIRFLVDDWSFANSPSGILAAQNPYLSFGFDYLMVPHPVQYENDMVDQNKYTFSYTEVTDGLNGKPGQSSQNPESDFWFHEVSRIDGNIYDPSYGNHTQYPNSPSFTSDYEDMNVAGFYMEELLDINESPNGINMDINGDGIYSNSVLVLIRFVRKHVSDNNNSTSFLYVSSEQIYH